MAFYQLFADKKQLQIPPLFYHSVLLHQQIFLRIFYSYLHLEQTKVYNRLVRHLTTNLDLRLEYNVDYAQRKATTEKQGKEHR